MATMNRFAVVAILLLTFIGISNSAYLAAGVSSSQMAEYGLTFFILVFILAAIDIRHNSPTVRRFIQMIVAIGFIVSAYFMFMQLSMGIAWCIYCGVSATLSLLIFIGAYFIEPIGERQIKTHPERIFRAKLTMPPSLS
jgi:hypothetical protein